MAARDRPRSCRCCAAADRSPPRSSRHSLEMRDPRLWCRRDKGKKGVAGEAIDFESGVGNSSSAHRALPVIPKALAQIPLEDFTGPALRELGVRELDPPRHLV